MTLCIAWRDNQGVHFASDSRLKLAANSFADVGIKVLALPYQVFQPIDASSGRSSIAFSGELGMCFAGSAVNSLTIKEALADVLKTLQHVPGHTDTSMQGIANFVLVAYREISRKICQTVIADKGRADILIGGFCQEKQVIRVFRFSTDQQNQHCCKEVLQTLTYELLGSGAGAAQADMPQSPTHSDYFDVLKSVINDPAIDSVGGNVQYGRFKDDRFVVHGVYEIGPPPHYWRGGLDMNSKDFLANESGFIPGAPFIDPYSTIGT